MQVDTRKKILFIAMGNSIHTVRWVSMLNDSDYEVHLFSSYIIPFFDYNPCFGRKINLHNFSTKFSDYLSALSKNIVRLRRQILTFNPTVIKSALSEIIKDEEPCRLAELINKHEFDIVHTLHTQTSAALLLKAKENGIAKMPKWINSVWGSDLYFHSRLRRERELLSKVLSSLDYYWGEGFRDFDLASRLGFKGVFLPPVPAYGGYNIKQIDSVQRVPPSQRRSIAIKGYQNVVGRATVAFRALELCVDLLNDFEINLFSFENEIILIVAQLFSEQYGIKINIIKGVEYEKILEMYSRSRVYIGLSISDGLPASLTEAMAMGAFPIQSNTSMADEWVEDGKTALLVHPEDPKMVAAALRRALTDDFLVDEAAELNVLSIKNRMDNEKIADKVIGIYDAVCSGQKEFSLDKISKDETVLVSIVTVTYNHKRYIKQAIEGVVSQITNFRYEFLIGDDASNDNTGNIIRDYANRYPDVIVPVIRTKNLGALRNLDDLISRSRGKYVALCDGDDYWTDVYKLQKQIDFLEAHSDYTICVHPVKQTFESSDAPDEILDPLVISSDAAVARGYLTIHDLIKMNSISSLSVVYKWQLPRQLPRWMMKYKIADYPLHLLHADKGKIGVVREVMGVYRKHERGSWWQHNSLEHRGANLSQFISLLEDINNELNGKYQSDFKPVLHYLYKVELPKLYGSDTLKNPSRLLYYLNKVELPKLYESDALKNSSRFQNSLETQSGSNIEVEHLSTISRKTRMKVKVKTIIKKFLRCILPASIFHKVLCLYRIDVFASLLEQTKGVVSTLEQQIKEIVSTQEAIVLRQETQKQRMDEVVSRQVADGQKIETLIDVIRYGFMKNDYENNGESDFEKTLARTIAVNLLNHFEDNYDEVFSNHDDIMRCIEGWRDNYSVRVRACLETVKKDIPDLARTFYNLHDGTSKDYYLKLLAWRILGFTKIKLLSDDMVKREKELYERLPSMELEEFAPVDDASFQLKCYDLSTIGFPFRCYTVPSSIVMNFLRLQYENEFVQVERGDVVFDCGACWGDTSLMLAHRVGSEGKVFAFEFVSSNIKIFKMNTNLNPLLESRIELITQPVSDVSGKRVMTMDKGTSTSVVFNEFDNSELTIKAETISIDDFVFNSKVKKIDFIKMDIEGAEMDALRGAGKSLRRFLPKLAIAIYHKTDDIWRIPTFIKEIDSRYEIFIKHNSRSTFETVMLAYVKKERRNND